MQVKKGAIHPRAEDPDVVVSCGERDQDNEEGRVRHACKCKREPPIQELKILMWWQAVVSVTEPMMRTVVSVMLAGGEESRTFKN